MKTPFICFIVIFLTIRATYVQSVKTDVNPLYKKRISVPLYKENSTIDSLINVAISGIYSVAE